MPVIYDTKNKGMYGVGDQVKETTSYHADRAEAAATSANTSADNALASEQAAALSETSADADATAAAVSESNAATSASNSSNSAVNASDSAAAALVSEVNAANSEAATAADLVQTNQDTIDTAADVLATNADRVQTGLDLVATNQDTIDTAADLAATNADVIQTGLDRVATGQDVVATNADVVSTNADVVATNADVILCAASETAAAASAAEAATFEPDNFYLKTEADTLYDGKVDIEELVHPNILMNGSFSVNQWNPGSLSSTAFVADRWKAAFVGSAGSVTTDINGLNLTASATGFTYGWLRQRVEADAFLRKVRHRTRFNGFENVEVTVSCKIWNNSAAAADRLCKFAILKPTAGKDTWTSEAIFRQSDAFTVTVGNHTEYTASFEIDSVDYSDGISFGLEFSDGIAGSQTLAIQDFKAEFGEKTTFVTEDAGEQLALCQRYYVTQPNIRAIGYAYTASAEILWPISFPVGMRVNPSITQSNPVSQVNTTDTAFRITGTSPLGTGIYLRSTAAGNVGLQTDFAFLAEL